MSAVGLMFPNKNNREYFAKIESRADLPACESLFALSLLYEEILSLPCCVDTSSLVFERSPMGKPYFKDSDVKFNISHSRGYVACAVSIGEEVGVDIEASEISEEKAVKLAQRYFFEYDLTAVSLSPKKFARIWSEKEAKAKFYGGSLTNLLEKERKSGVSHVPSEITLHKFSYGEIPVTLCTKRTFSTICYYTQQ
jgi:phosphopantetheinyl transferase